MGLLSFFKPKRSKSFGFQKAFVVPVPFKKDFKRLGKPLQKIKKMAPPNPILEQGKKTIKPILDVVPPLPENSVDFAFSTALGASFGSSIPALTNLGRLRTGVNIARKIKNRRQQNKGSI